MLKPYGGTGAYDRSEQISNSFLQGELTQLRAMAAVIPSVFLLISAFLVNMILARLVTLEREQIGLLKALGYANATIAWHYAKLVIAISCVGLAIGAAIGTWLGQALTRLYVEFFSFPFLVFDRSPDLYAIAGGVTVLAALAGAAKAIYSVVILPPATAMRPPLPARYRRLLGKSRHSSRLFSQLTIMSLRHLWHWPVRTGITILGTSLSVALLITALFSYDSIELMIDTVFFQQNRHDATLAFGISADPSIVQDIAAWPGVLKAEPFRDTSVLIRHEHKQKRLSILGIPAGADLSRILDHRACGSATGMGDRLWIFIAGVTRICQRSVSHPAGGRLIHGCHCEPGRHVGRTALEPGDRVIAGQSVVSSIHPLDPPFLDRRTEAELNAAAAAGRFAIELAQAERERAHNELQLATAQLKSSNATVRLREAELANTEAKRIQPRTDEGKFALGTTCCVDIVAPIDGVILSMVTRSEQAVNTGTIIAELGNPDDLEIRVDLLSSDAVRVNVGSRVSFSDWGGEQLLTGTVSRIESAAFTHVSALGIEEQRVNLIMQIDDVPKGLGHGYRVFARITVWQADDIVQVPISALFRHEGQWSVFTHENQTASRQSISIGHMNATHAQVLDGLNDDDHVILYPSDRVEDNVSIELRNLAI